MEPSKESYNTYVINSVKNGLHGEIEIPGDKSVSHRSVMFSGLAETPVHIKNFLPSADCLSTVSCMEAMGVKVQRIGDTELIVQGNGINGLKEPETVLDAGNSGTTLRLLMGILAPQSFFATFTGDASLSRRPMGRVIKPLSMMGAKFLGRKENTRLPITAVPTVDKAGKPKLLKAITYDSPVASAQVKSAILLAGLFADGKTTVNEPYTSRNHTELMLKTFGVEPEINGTSVSVSKAEKLTAPEEIIVPGDISSAAFWMVAASIIPGSDLILKNVGINTTRTGIIDVLNAMGADITIFNKRKSGGESVADMQVRSARLQGTAFGADIIPRLIDEIPAIAVAAMFAEGKTVITGAGELRVKETDRLQAVTDEFRKLGANIEDTEDGLIITGGKSLRWAECDSRDDHRMAMSLAVAGMAGAGVQIKSGDCVRISYPDFFDIVRRYV